MRFQGMNIFKSSHTLPNIGCDKTKKLRNKLQKFHKGNTMIGRAIGWLEGQYDVWKGNRMIGRAIRWLGLSCSGNVICRQTFNTLMCLSKYRWLFAYNCDRSFQTMNIRYMFARSHLTSFIHYLQCRNETAQYYLSQRGSKWSVTMYVHT